MSFDPIGRSKNGEITKPERCRSARSKNKQRIRFLRRQVTLCLPRRLAVRVSRMHGAEEPARTSHPLPIGGWRRRTGEPHNTVRVPPLAGCPRRHGRGYGLATGSARVRVGVEGREGAAGAVPVRGSGGCVILPRSALDEAQLDRTRDREHEHQGGRRRGGRDHAFARQGGRHAAKREVTRHRPYAEQGG